VTAGIYTLNDPTTHEVRYVGQTRFAKRRKWQHGSETNNRSERRISRWARGLIAAGKRPLFVLIERTDDLDAREVFWIAEHKRRGAKLLNMNEGGATMEHVASSPRSNTKGRIKTPLHQIRSHLTRALTSLKRYDMTAYERLKAKIALADAAIERAVKREGKHAAFDRINAALARRKKRTDACA
jgi:hypothetical protein